MKPRELRLQAAVINDHEILIVRVRLADGREFWLLPGGGREPADADEFAAVAREVREETGLEVRVERLLLDSRAHPDDATYERYRTFECRPAPGASAEPAAHDGIASILAVRWLRLGDEGSWGPEIVNDKFLAPQLRAIRAVLATPVTDGF